MREPAWRLLWAAVVIGAGLGLARGLFLATYFEPTGEALAARERGLHWLWLSTLALWLASATALWRWRVSPTSAGLVALGGPIGLMVESWGWLPPLALVVIVPMLLIGCAGTLLAPPRAGPELR